MIKITMSLIMSMFAFSAFAGTTTSYKNEALNFSLIVPAMGDFFTICDYQDACFDFDLVKEQNSVSYYKEVRGLCRLEVEYFSKDFGKGKTKNDFMLNLSAMIVHVIEGEDKCQLNQELPKQKRSLTAVYGL